MGILLTAAPWIFDFSRGGAETIIPVVLGSGMILYSLLTNYEMGVIKVIPIRTHLGIDFISGIFLAISPWLFGFSEFVYLPHLIVGVLEVGASWMTDTVTTSISRRHQRHAH